MIVVWVMASLPARLGPAVLLFHLRPRLLPRGLRLLHHKLFAYLPHPAPVITPSLPSLARHPRAHLLCLAHRFRALPTILLPDSLPRCLHPPRDSSFNRPHRLPRPPNDHLPTLRPPPPLRTLLPQNLHPLHRLRTPAAIPPAHYTLHPRRAPPVPEVPHTPGSRCFLHPH